MNDQRDSPNCRSGFQASAWHGPISCSPLPIYQPVLQREKVINTIPKKTRTIFPIGDLRVLYVFEPIGETCWSRWKVKLFIPPAFRGEQRTHENAWMTEATCVIRVKSSLWWNHSQYVLTDSWTWILSTWSLGTAYYRIPTMRRYQRQSLIQSVDGYWDQTDQILWKTKHILE